MDYLKSIVGKILYASGVTNTDLRHIPNLVISALCVFLIELMVTGYQKSSLKRLLTFKNKTERIDAYMWTVMLFNLYNLLAIIFTFGICWKLFYFIKARYHLNLILNIPNGYLQFFIVLLLTDLQHYFTHRFFHYSNFYWEFHKYHHSATKLSVLTLHRQHPFTEHFHNLFSIPIVIILGAPIQSVFLVIFIREVQGYLLHTELYWDWGIIGKYFLMSPAAHILHHSNNHKHYGKNFGQGFVFWDRLFKTYADPKSEKITTLGLDDDNINDKNYVHGMMHCCMQAFKTIRVKRLIPKKNG